MYLTPLRPRILAHRGFWWTDVTEDPIAENSIRAFAAAEALGAKYVETDARATRDGVAVLLHDPDFVTADGKKHQIRDVDSSELARLTLSTGDKIPTLAEALTAFPNMRFNIDLKEAAAVEPAVAVITELGASSRTLVTSFSRSRRRQAAKRLVNAFTGSGKMDATLMLIAVLLRQQWMLNRLGESIHAAQLPGQGRAAKLLTPAHIARLQRARIEVHVWTINTREEMQQWLDRGVDGIVTDRADLALTLVADLQARNRAATDSEKTEQTEQREQ